METREVRFFRAARLVRSHLRDCRRVGPAANVIEMPYCRSFRVVRDARFVFARVGEDLDASMRPTCSPSRPPYDEWKQVGANIDYHTAFNRLAPYSTIGATNRAYVPNNPLIVVQRP